MKTIDKKRLTIDLSNEEHFKLKVLASYEGLSMKDYLLSHTLRGNKENEKKGKNDETHYLLKSENNRQRIINALASKKPARTFHSLKELKHALGI